MESTFWALLLSETDCRPPGNSPWTRKASTRTFDLQNRAQRAPRSLVSPPDTTCIHDYARILPPALPVALCAGRRTLALPGRHMCSRVGCVCRERQGAGLRGRTDLLLCRRTQCVHETDSGPVSRARTGEVAARYACSRLGMHDDIGHVRLSLADVVLENAGEVVRVRQPCVLARPDRDEHH